MVFGLSSRISHDFKRDAGSHPVCSTMIVSKYNRRIEDRGYKIEDGRLKMEDGRWKTLEDRGSRIEDRRWKDEGILDLLSSILDLLPELTCGSRFLLRFLLGGGSLSLFLQGARVGGNFLR